MISKELLCEVVGFSTDEIRYIEDELNEDNCLVYVMDYDHLQVPINVHELAHKCKEWAFDKHNLNIIAFKINNIVYKFEIATIINSQGVWFTKYSNKATSEPEAIFKACQWILEKQIKEN